LFLPSSGKENGAKPPNDPASPKVILMAKSETRTIYLQFEPENRVCQCANSCETDFASNIKSAQEPGVFTSDGARAGHDLFSGQGSSTGASRAGKSPHTSYSGGEVQGLAWGNPDTVGAAASHIDELGRSVSGRRRI
jgi:hypothetical protein